MLKLFEVIQVVKLSKATKIRVACKNNICHHVLMCIDGICVVESVVVWLPFQCIHTKYFFKLQ